jgi:hypothetical protein
MTAVAALMSAASTVHTLGATSEERFETIPLRNAFALRAEPARTPPPLAEPALPRGVRTGLKLSFK